jgi:hypothetical protein
MSSSAILRWLLVAALASEFALAGRSEAANWSVARTNSQTLTPPGGVTVANMSGVTYLGQASGNHRFFAVMQTGAKAVEFNVAFDANGAITGITDVTQFNINVNLTGYDFEGAAYTIDNPARNSVWVAAEQGPGPAQPPGVREITLGGNFGTLQNLNNVISDVYDPPNVRTNKGFESLARNLEGTVMWTANEQALVPDGGLSTGAAGTTVRLQRLNVAGNAVTAAQQFAYVTEPIHSTVTSGSPQNGLAELTVMPDGTLLALERSVAVASPLYMNRIFQVNYGAATNVDQGALATGLIGQTYAAVGKEQLWSGAVDGAAGQNMEGLALGPKLANGKWVLLGVVDDGTTSSGDSDPASGNTLVAFTATPLASGDFNGDGVVDGADLVKWQVGLGKVANAAKKDGDADLDGDVDAADLAVWKAAAGPGAVSAVPEPCSLMLWPTVILLAKQLKRAAQTPEKKSG